MFVQTTFSAQRVQYRSTEPLFLKYFSCLKSISYLTIFIPSSFIQALLQGLTKYYEASWKYT